MLSIILRVGCEGLNEERVGCSEGLNKKIFSIRENIWCEKKIDK